MRASTREKYKAVQDRYKQLYHVKRMRVDDVYEKLAQEFFISVRWVEEVLRMDLTAAEPAQNKS